MPLRMITGEFRVVGTQPDGDSVRFYPADPDAWSKTGVRARVNPSGGVQLRLDAIDALETHYTPPKGTGRLHQPVGLGRAATASLLDRLGFTGVVTDEASSTVTAATPPAAPGFVLTRVADTYGRPVALAYPGAPGDAGITAPDLAPVQVDLPLLGRSVNQGLLADGLVYPTFYAKLYVDLRAELARVAVAARDTKSGVWAADATVSGFTLTSRAQLADELVILPKLFRRVAEYLALEADQTSVDLAQFPGFLAAHADALFTVPDGHATTLDTLVEVTGQTVRLTVPPERIVFAEK